MIINGKGLGDANCPITPQGDCVLNGMPVSCSLIRECDSQTGTLHYEYATPGGSSGNVNINVANPTNGMILGYNDAQGRFVDTTDVPISSLTTAKKPIIKSDDQSQSPFFAMTQQYRYNPNPSGMGPLQFNTQAGSVTGAVVNTPQTTTSQQGNPAHSTVTNTNASSSGGAGNNSVTPTPGTTVSSVGSTFSDLVTSGSGWLSGSTHGVPNWLIAAAGVGGVAWFATGQHKRFR